MKPTQEPRVPSKPTGAYRDLVALVREQESRVARRSPFYMAKYVMGFGQRKNGRLWGWNQNHVEASKLIWWAYTTREERPWGSLVYLEWCRGSRKSTLIQSALLCFIIDDPNLPMLLDGDVASKAAQKVDVVRGMIENPYFVALFGDLKGKSKKWRADEFVVERTVSIPDSTLKASGLDVSKTGGHFKIIVPDDIQTDENADSPTINEQVKRNFRLYESLKSGLTGTLTLMGGTRWGFRDIGADIQKMSEDEERKGFKKSIFISRKAAFRRMKDGEGGTRGGGSGLGAGSGMRLDKRFAEFPEGGLDLEALRRIEFQQRASLFSFNYLLQPLSEEEALIQSDWVKHHTRTLQDFDVEETRFYLTIDPAGEGGFKGADYNALVVTAITKDTDIYVLETVKRHMKKLELFDEIVRLNEQYPLNGVMIETYFQQYTLAGWLKTKASQKLVSIPWVKFKSEKRSKDVRIKSLQPYFQRGKILWRKEHVELEDEALSYPRGEHDDLIDALAHVLKAAAVPTEQQRGPWYMNEAWKDEGAFVPTAKQPEPPSDLAVQVARMEYIKKQARSQRGNRRFRSGGFRR